MFFNRNYYSRICSFFLLSVFLFSFVGNPLPSLEQNSLCKADKIKTLEKSVSVESRDPFRFASDLVIKRLLAIIGIDASTLGVPIWNSFQPFLIDRSYKCFNRAILAAKHHPPTLT